MESSDFNVIIVGAGPAGSTCASFLGKKGIKTLLLDAQKFPRDKTCGDGISGKSVRVLRALGLHEKVKSIEHCDINNVLIGSPNGQMVQIPIPKKQGVATHGYVSRREVYDNFLFENATAQSSVTTLQKYQVLKVLKEGDRVTGVRVKDLENGQEKEFKCKVLVGADGANSVIARELGLLKIEPEHFIVAIRQYYENVSELTDAIEFYFTPEILPGYFWIFPNVEGNQKGICNVGVGMVSKDMKAKGVSLEKAMKNAIEQYPILRERFKNAKPISPLKGWNLPVGSIVRPNSGNGFLLVGDAASLIDPFTGEGIGNAMMTGWMAADTIERALEKNDFSAETLKVYTERVESELRPELMNAYKMQKLTKYPWLLNYVVGKAKKKPEVAQFIGTTLVTEDRQEKMGKVKFFFKLVLG